ncbi:MAG: FkbM family methyltransferase [Alistipes sp.]|jgi:precorrin-6B methylase 2|nr:FkbM family methyltransferase [Alistipes sp.]
MKLLSFATQKRLSGRIPFLATIYRRHFFYRESRKRILRDVGRNPALYAEPELAAAVEYIFRHGISVLSYDGCERYDRIRIAVHHDEEGWPWVDHGGRRLYFRRGSDAEMVKMAYRSLLKEQDHASPHCYLAPRFEVREGDVLLDIGAAEGIWALDNVEKASRVVLFEAKQEWIGALERTFAPWRNKVTIVDKYASDMADADSVTVDAVVRRERLDGPLLLKIDVEGAEERVLDGAGEVLARPDTRAVICTYHRQDDHTELSEKMRRLGFRVDTSRGYMLFVFARDLQPPFFRRGMIYCKR